MSRHTIEVPSTTPSGRAVLVLGYDTFNGPHFFCWMQDSAERDKVVWSSITSLDLFHAQSPDEFEPALAEHGVTVPEFLKKALWEDWNKNLRWSEYCWFEDGAFEQTR